MDISTNAIISLYFLILDNLFPLSSLFLFVAASKVKYIFFSLLYTEVSYFIAPQTLNFSIIQLAAFSFSFFIYLSVRFFSSRSIFSSSRRRILIFHFTLSEIWRKLLRGWFQQKKKKTRCRDGGKLNFYSVFVGWVTDKTDGKLYSLKRNSVRLLDF